MQRTRTSHFLAAFAAAALLVSSPAHAQEERFLVGLEAGLFEPTGFADSYDAVYGETLAPLGARFEWAFSRRFALALATSFMSADGEQVAILPGGEILPTGIATEIELNPWHLTVAWRIHPEGPWSGHLGLGPSYVRYRESNEFEEISVDELGGHAAAGVRRSFGRWVVGAEALYSSFSGALDEAGAAGFFGEDDLGGFTAKLSVGYAF